MMTYVCSTSMRFWLKILIVPEAACRAKSPARNQAVQPSLLRGVNLDKPVPRRYDLVGMAAFEGRKENLSLSLKRKLRARTASAAPEVAPTKRPCLVAVNADRFAFSNEDIYGKMSVPFVPKNTKPRVCNRSRPQENCSRENRAPFFRSASYV